MQSVEYQTDQSVIRRTLLAAGLGAALGLQGWRLAVVLSVPWYGAVWVWVGHLFLGISVGITAGLARWWKRGIGLGLAFGLASGFGALALGMKWVPFGLAAITASIISGLLTAVIADAVYPIGLASEENREGASPAEHRERTAPSRRVAHTLSRIGKRLAEEAATLDNLDRERLRRRKPGFGKSAEDRIVWSELLDLELQDIDERLEKICRETENPSDRGPRTA